ncbi:MAG: universal stress protein [Myxococcota bacterium]
MSDSPATHILVPVDFSACSLERRRGTLSISPRSGDSKNTPRFTASTTLRWTPRYSSPQHPSTREALQEYTTRRANEAMTAFMRNLNASQGNLPQVQVVIGHPVSAIIEAARHDVDLIVMGTHGHTEFLHALVGSVHQIVRLASCPVMTLRTPDEVATHGHPLRVAPTV